MGLDIGLSKKIWAGRSPPKVWERIPCRWSDHSTLWFASDDQSLIPMPPDVETIS